MRPGGVSCAASRRSRRYPRRVCFGFGLGRGEGREESRRKESRVEGGGREEKKGEERRRGIDRDGEEIGRKMKSERDEGWGNKRRKLEQREWSAPARDAMGVSAARVPTVHTRWWGTYCRGFAGES